MLIFSGAPLVLFVPGEPAIRLWLRLIATLDDDDDDDDDDVVALRSFSFVDRIEGMAE